VQATFSDQLAIVGELLREVDRMQRGERRATGRPAPSEYERELRLAGLAQRIAQAYTVIEGVLAFVARRIDRSPLAGAVSPDGKTLYVSDKTALCVAVLDVAAGKKVREVAIAGEPNGLALSADGKTLYVAQRKANSIALIDTAKGAVTSQIPVGTWPVALAVAENTKRLYCSNRGHHEGSPNGARPQAPAREPQGPRAARNRGPDRVRALAVMQGELGSSVRDCPRCFERLHVVFQPKWHSG